MLSSYFLIGCIATGAGLIVTFLARSNRGLVFASGVFAAPAGLGDYMFVPEYWNPVHIIGPWFSIEGLLFSFGNGCLVLALVQNKLPLQVFDRSESLLKIILRLTIVMMIGFCAFLLLWQGGAGQLMIMHATLVGFIVMIVFLHRRRSFSFKTALFAGVGFCLIYMGETVLWYWIDPNFGAYWTSRADYWLIMPFPPGLPIEEFVWSFAYGAVWSNLMLYGFQSSEAPMPAVKSNE